MANEVNRIQINTNYQIGGIGNKPEERANKEDDKKEKNIEHKAETKSVPAGDVLSYMTAQAASVRPKESAKVLDVSKYVTPEQAQRICGFISQFEEAVVNGLKSIENEFGQSVLTEDAKMDLAVELFKAQNM